MCLENSRYENHRHQRLPRSAPIPDYTRRGHTNPRRRPDPHGTLDCVREFNDFLGTLPHPHQIFIAGNHDFCFENDRNACEEILTNCIYLQDEEVTLNGVKFSGIPWQRCQFHLQQNTSQYVPRQSMKREVAADIRAIFNAPDQEQAEAQLRRTVEKYAKRASRLADWL